MTVLLGIGLVMAGAIVGLVVASWMAVAGRADECDRAYQAGYKNGYNDGKSGFPYNLGGTTRPEKEAD